MTSKEYIIWLKGFTEGVHDFNVTPKQWDIMKEKLAEVSDDEFVEPPGMFQDHTVQSYPPYWSPQSPFYTTSGTSGSMDIRSIVSQWTGTPNGTGLPGTVITTTPGTGYITVTNPNSFTTSTATSLPSGSTIRYTNSTDKTLLHD